MAGVNDPEQLDARRRREFRRLVFVSIGAHIAVLVGAVVTPAPASMTPPGVITVELVSAPPALAPARKPPATPVPKAPEPVAPAPTPPTPKQVVLPKESTEAATQPKAAKPKPTKKRREVVLDPAKPDKSLEELMAEMRNEAGETAPSPKPVETSTAKTPGGSPGGPGRPVSPEVLEWVRRAKVHVQQNWVVAPGFRMQDLETHVTVKLDASGRVLGTPEISRRSGNPWYDESVVRGIQKASPLPAPPDAGEWPFVFAPEEAF